MEISDFTEYGSGKIDTGLFIMSGAQGYDSSKYDCKIVPRSIIDFGASGGHSGCSFAELQ